MSVISGSGRRAGSGASWARWLIAGWAAALVAALATGGCALSRSGNMDQNCTADGECDDGNPCTVGACSADGFCSYTALPDGALEEQTAHDCQNQLCASGQPVAEEDVNDRPVDEPCVVYDCVDMVLETEEHTNGEACELNDIPGVCTAEGNCDIGCETNEDCQDDNACTDNTCNVGTGECVSEPLNNVLAPGSQQEPGDCKQILCQDGTETDIIDDTDLPIDDNDCTEDLCNQGQPTNPDEEMNFPCSVPNGQYEKVCDGQGTCVECNGPSQCDHLPTDTFCGSRTCTAGVCGQDCVANNTPTSAQTPGDCKTRVCDGACGETDIVNAPDLPVDNNDCTQDLCTGMTPSNPPEPVNTACGSQGTLYCNGSGTCVGCTNSNQCPTDVFCRDHYCNSQQQCDWNDTANNTPLPSQDQTTGDCQELQCNGVGGIKSVAINDPYDDGIDCTQDLCVSGNPVHSDRPLNYSCNDNGGTYCDGNGACVECNSPNQCPTAPVCQYRTCTNNSCGTGNYSSSTPAPVSYQTDGDCKTRVCNGSGGVNGDVPEDSDLPDDNNECTINDCNNGTPTFPPVTNGTVCTPNGQFCDGVEECQSGSCTSPGDPCQGEDGDNDCSETCREVQDDCNGWDTNGSSCNDNLYCTNTDACSSGVCVGSGNPCTGPDNDNDCSESCDENANNCNANDPNGSSCNDNQFCTDTDECSNGSCVGTGDPCNGPDNDSDCSETCDENANNCNGNDPNGSSCNDNQFCTDTDECNNGSCVGTGDPCNGPDNDDDCSETCDENANNCNGNDPDGSACNDNLFCTDTDECSGGNCVGTGNPCTGQNTGPLCDDSCNESQNNCTGSDASGTSCNDTYSCTTTDECDGGGNCVGTGSTCGDGSVCAPTETCDDHNTSSCGTCSANCQTTQAGGDCPLGTGCASTSDCTSPAVCSSDVCCIPQGAACNNDPDCCSGNCLGNSTCGS